MALVHCDRSLFSVSVLLATNARLLCVTHFSLVTPQLHPIFSIPYCSDLS